MQHEFRQLGWRSMRLNARRLDDVQLILLAIEDVTDRERVEKSLEENRVRMSAIVTTATDAIITVDDLGIIESLNPATQTHIRI